MTEAFWQLLLSTNLIGPFRCAHAAADSLQDSRGTIVNMKGLPKHGLPIPQGDYVPATRHGAFIFTAGMTPRRDGELIRTGRIPRDASPEDYRDAVVLACANALTAARHPIICAPLWLNAARNGALQGVNVAAL